VEINLTSFQDDLAAVSAEIETLQARSTALSIRLENRKAVENGLGPIVEEISLSPAVVRKVVEGAIDEAWVRALAEVEKRSKAMDAKSQESRKIKGINDLKPLLENLINKVKKTLGVQDEILTSAGNRKNPRLPSSTDQGLAISKYKCPNYTTTALHPVQRPLCIFT
jgi:hypothetical protein